VSEFQVSYFRPVNLSKELLIRAVGMVLLLAVIYKLQLLTEEKMPHHDLSTRDKPICDVSNPEVSNPDVSKPKVSSPDVSKPPVLTQISISLFR
jgi:hypothetical protein